MKENDEMREDFAEETTEETLPTEESTEEIVEPIETETDAFDPSDEESYAEAAAADIPYVPAEAAVTATAEAEEEAYVEASPAEEAFETAETPEDEPIEAEKEEMPVEEAKEESPEEALETAPAEETFAEEKEAEETVETSLEEKAAEDAVEEPISEDEPVAGALKESDFMEEDAADAAEEILPADAEETEAPAVLPVSTSAEAPAEKAAEPAEKPAPEKKENYTWQELKLRKKYKMEQDPLFHANEVIPGFIIARGERVVRTYNCLATKKGDGTICLTNKRLLVNAGERSEVAIEQISGIKFSRYSQFYFLRFIFAFLFLAIAVCAVLIPHLNNLPFAIPNITGEARKAWAVILCYVGGGLSALISLPIWLKIVKRTFYFYIYAHQDTPFVECKSAAYLKSEAKGKVSKCMVASSGKESEKAARELGALLIEIKEGRFDD